MSTRRSALFSGRVVLALLAMSALASSGAFPRAAITWSGGGATNNWNDTANWTGGVVPGTGDVATFNGTSAKNCAINVAADVQGIDIQAAYTGTITQAAGVTVRTGLANFSQAAGAFAGGDSTIEVNGNFTLSGGTFTSTSARLRITGAFSHTGGTFNANGGTVLLGSVSNQNLTLSAPTPFNDLVINDGLFGYWKLDETASPSRDSSGSGSDGAWANGPAASPDVPAVRFSDPYSLQFNGVNQYVRVPRSTILEPGNTFTVMCWMKRNGNATQATRWSALFRKTWMNNSAPTWGSYALQLPQNAYDTVMFGTGHATVVDDLQSTAGSIPDLTWVHVCGVYDPAGAAPQKRLYINGVLNSSRTLTQPIVYDTTSTGDLFLGVAGPVTGEYFNGWIDEIRLYSRPLSDPEILAIAQGNFASSFVSTQTLTGGPLRVNGNLTIASGRLDVGPSNLAINVAGSWLNQGGAFLPGTGAVTFDGAGTSNQILSNTQAFNNITIGAPGPAADWTLNDATTANGTLAITTGTLTQTTWNLAAATLTVGASGTWQNASTGSITLGAGGVTNSGLIFLDGGGGGCASPAVGDPVQIRSTAPGTQRPWNGTGVFTIYDVDVRDQAGAATITAYSSTNSGNNGANWVFDPNCPVPPASSSGKRRSSCGCGTIEGARGAALNVWPVILGILGLLVVGRRRTGAPSP